MYSIVYMYIYLSIGYSNWKYNKFYNHSALQAVKS